MHNFGQTLLFIKKSILRLNILSYRVRFHKSITFQLQILSLHKLIRKRGECTFYTYIKNSLVRIEIITGRLTFLRLLGNVIVT